MKSPRRLHRQGQDTEDGVATAHLRPTKSLLFGLLAVKQPRPFSGVFLCLAERTTAWHITAADIDAGGHIVADGHRDWSQSSSRYCSA